jgi:bla regulator protein blaR1
MKGRACLAGLLCVGAGVVFAQAPAAPKAAAPAKPMTFDVISIRLDQSDVRQQSGSPPYGPTADGYRMTHMPLLLPIIAAYIPQSGAATFPPSKVKGMPEWATQEFYDIDAKVADEDLVEWQKPASQKTMLPAMMQALLADRCKIVAHREIKDQPVYLLELGRNGPRFKESDPSVEHPEGEKLPWGGVIVQSRDVMNLYGTSMASLVTLMSQISSMGASPGGRQVQDKTGLTGKYDITIKMGAAMGGPPPGGDTGVPMASDPAGGMSSMIVSMAEQLGLKIESGKAPVETLVIDHIERPSAN